MAAELDWKFYTETYKDLSRMNAAQALHHWINHGRKEGRMPHANYVNDFDYEYYISAYPDLRNMDYAQARAHYNLHGKREGRLAKLSVSHIDTVTTSVTDDEKSYVPSGKPEQKINLLIRTCKRPNYFRACVQSIVSQNYSNYMIHVSYDTQESFDYIQPLVCDKLRAYYVNMDAVSKQPYRFNLYCNELLEQVDDGFVIFLDDDDVLTHSHVLEKINDRLADEKSVVLWKFARVDQVVSPSGAPNVKLGSIDTSCVCFHSSRKNLSRWPDRQQGDFAFFSRLFKCGSDKKLFEYFYIPNILTKTIYQKKVAGYGFRGELESA